MHIMVGFVVYEMCSILTLEVFSSRLILNLGFPWYCSHITSTKAGQVGIHSTGILSEIHQTFSRKFKLYMFISNLKLLRASVAHSIFILKELHFF